MMGARQVSKCVAVVIIVIYCFIFMIDVCDASVTMDHVARCTTGETLNNTCVSCVCTPSQNYRCTPNPSCPKDVKHKLSGKNSPSHCEPRMIYAINNLSCLCSPDGHWFNQKCESQFRNLAKSGPKKLKKKTKLKARNALRCEPNAYFTDDCNVCRCSPDGKVARSQCTKNICHKESFEGRRDIGKLQSSCIAGYWYSLAPCQFCHCHHSNKLVCSTGSLSSEGLLELGSYKLSVCGKDLIKEIMELVPNESVLRKGHSEQDVNNNTVFTTSTTTEVPRTPSVEVEPDNLNPNEMNSEDKIEYKMVYDEVENEFNKNLQSGVLSTAGPTFNDTGEELKEKVEEEAQNSKPVQDSPSTTPSTPTSKETILDQESDDEMTRSNFQAETDSVLFEEQPDSQHVLYKLDLPAVIDQIIHMALRKSMVKLNLNSHCIPGQTKHINCNFCYCLSNGKLLCTDKKCDTDKRDKTAI